ncbi:MAG: nucleotidyltransferase domain-containing protein [Oscillospiraceae bacterium]|jgi:type I restriction enzyme S subunit|nr:nucleotidyltransferase domain-containing protein [Oscillospiraceae bacterium]
MDIQGLTNEDLAEVQRILRQYVPGCEVRAYGSRWRGDAWMHSDLDLAVIGPQKLGWTRIAELSEAFQESNLYFRVDVHDYNALPEYIRKRIDAGYETLQAP